MTFIQAVILGIVEGVTEFLPISSTAHLELVSTFMGVLHTPFVKSFQIIIQFGAILAVVVLYATTLFRRLEIWKRILAAFIPTGLIGFALYSVVKTYLLGNITISLFTLGLGGLVLIWFDSVHRPDSNLSSREELEAMPYWKAATIGVAQAVAIVPGVSRSAATIISGMMLGLSRRAVVEFSFLLAVPTMLVAAGYELVKNASAFSTSELGILSVGFIVSFISALAAISFFLRIIKHRSLTFFGIYRIIIVFIILMLI